MLEVGSDPDLAEKTVGSEYRAQLREQHLESDVPVVPEIARQVDGRHPAAAYLAVDGVATGERRVQNVDRRGHLHRPRGTSDSQSLTDRPGPRQATSRPRVSCCPPASAGR